MKIRSMNGLCEGVELLRKYSDKKKRILMMREVLFLKLRISRKNRVKQIINFVIHCYSHAKVIIISFNNIKVT